MRYLFWLSFCGLISWALAAKTNSVGTEYGVAKAWIYGAVIGLGFALGTSTRKQLSLRLRVIASLIWFVACTLLYVWFFEEVSQSERSGVILIGILLSVPGAVVILIPIHSKPGNKAG
jgi:hypothetical protein